MSVMDGGSATRTGVGRTARPWAARLGWIGWGVFGAIFFASLVLGWRIGMTAAAALGLGWAYVLMVYGRGEPVRAWVVALAINSVAGAAFVLFGGLGG